MSLQQKLIEICKGWPAARNEQFTNHPIAKKIRRELRTEIERIIKVQSDKKYLVKGSPGSGAWANVAWLSILDPNVTRSTEEGIYPVYLFCADGRGVYLSLEFGTTGLTKGKDIAWAKNEVKRLTAIALKASPKLKFWNDKIALSSTTDLGKSYEWATAGAKFYSVDEMPDDDVLQRDLFELLDIYSTVTGVMNGKTEPSEIQLKSGKSINNIDYTHLPKPFILLAGISGTGKTRFIREQARCSGGEAGTCCLVPVRPDWHEPSDILGYVSRLNGCAEYVTTDVLRFVAKAWLEILEAGVELDCDASGQAVGEFKALGNHDDLAAVRPFWLCLDEMNLAPVEQYFADYLSVIETREWVWDGDEFEYRCEPLLKPDVIQSIDEDKQIELRNKLGFGAERFDSVWQLICQTGLAIPFNLIVAGTVNMDETTHGFSRKVIDRALSIDFGEFFPNDFDQVFESSVENEVLSYPILSRALPENLPDIDKDGKKTIEFLKQVNGLLLHTPFELAFRTMNELLLAVVSFEPQSELELKAVWDDFLVCKVLPRIEGDVDKLATKDTEKSLLDGLFELLSGEFELLWREKTRPDLLRQMKSGDDKVVAVACRSKAKLEQMRQKLERSGFTTFWP